MLNLVGYPMCCSAYIITGVNDAKPEDFVKFVKAHTTQNYLISWSDNLYGNGSKIATYIRKNEKGIVRVSAPALGNHQREVRIWTWARNPIKKKKAA